MANQYSVDPRQLNFLANYLDKDSETYANCLQSALKAGYAREYAENLMNLMPKWLSDSMETLNDMKLLKKAEKVLNKTLDLEPVDENGKVDTPLLGIQNNTAKFVAERLNKQKYSTRQEVTGENGAPLQVTVMRYDDTNTV